MLNNHPRNVTAKNNEKLQEIIFCRECEANETCEHKYNKIHPISAYVYKYMIEFENGVKIYPKGRSWEYEPEWFVNLLTAAQNELHRIQEETAKGIK